jgi:hypothetical protein
LRRNAAIAQKQPPGAEAECPQNGIFSNFICLPGDHQAIYRKGDFAGAIENAEKSPAKQ